MLLSLHTHEEYHLEKKLKKETVILLFDWLRTYGSWILFMIDHSLLIFAVHVIRRQQMQYVDRDTDMFVVEDVNKSK